MQGVTCYIALGSNLGNKLFYITNAIADIASFINTELTDVAPLYKSIAIGPGSQEDYINTAIKLTTLLSPENLLEKLQQIENKYDRKRTGIANTARTLDLDILIYGNFYCNTAQLSIPHPRLNQRNFVVYPLHYLAPDLELHSKITSTDSLKNIKLRELLLTCSSDNISLYNF